MVGDLTLDRLFRERFFSPLENEVTAINDNASPILSKGGWKDQSRAEMPFLTRAAQLPKLALPKGEVVASYSHESANR